MPTNAKSMIAANGLQDIFARRGWRSFLATPTGDANTVCIQYKSAKFGKMRVVECRALDLAKWMDDNCLKPGFRPMLEGILDRKPERSTPVQQELFPDNAPPAIVRRSMGD